MIANIKEKLKIDEWRHNPVAILTIIAAVLFVAILAVETIETRMAPPQTMQTIPQETAGPYITPKTPLGRLTVFAKMHRLPLSDWPIPLVEFLEKYPETESYVLNYPFYKDMQVPIDLTSSLGADQMPLFIQWDARWGYTQYSGELFGTSGCGPASLSMVCFHLLQDAKFTPRYIADFSQSNGYYTTGKGSNWTLIYEGGEQLGLDVEDINMADKDAVMEELEAGNPIICVVGPGDFTYSGHFIVLAGLENGMIRINDPNSRVNSQKLWDYDTVAPQVEGSWVCTVPQTEE